ncbi:MAG TPA: SRPBCC family protein, partial [Candidatus Limnocylindrales bacterium]|nr:SRPBCC family protein [Candidatus Limnocylindrales bacterium]
MSHLATTIRVAAPPDIVFDLVADPARGPQWQTMISDMGEISGRPGGVGSSYIGYYRVAGRRLEGRFVVTAAERPTLHQAAGTTRGGWARWTTMIEPVDGGSEVRVDLEYELPGEMISSLLGKLTGYRLEQELSKTYDNLRKVAEAEARRAGPWSGAGRSAGGLVIADTPDTPSVSDDEGTAAPMVAEPVPA